MDFGLKLAIYLKKKKLRSYEFAKEIGKHPVEISNYITGIKKKPRLTTAEKIVIATEGHITLQDMGY